MKPKLIIILGPTSTGKSALAVDVARAYNGEIISADSRQVYSGLDIGTGKITQKEMRGIPHHLLDVVSPKKIFSVAEWKEQADTAILDILSRGKLPILCGGTGFYIQSIVENLVLPEVAPNITLRKKLEKMSVARLFSILTKLDPRRAENIEKQNPVRLIRAIEIAKALGNVPEIKRGESPYSLLQIGLALPETELKKKIHIRLLARMRSGMVAEARALHHGGLSFKRMRSLGLEYRHIADFLQGRISRDELTVTLDKKIWEYAKRQMTWFKRDGRIKWFKTNNTKEIKREVESFLKNI